MQPAHGEIIDFYQDWGSARNFWIGLPVYTEHAITIPRHLGIQSYADTGILYNAHPPTSVLLVLPLGRIEYRCATLIWNIISLSAFVISLLVVARVLHTPTGYLPLVFAVLPFCVPILGNLQVGQLNLVLASLVTAVWALDRSGYSKIAGTLLGAAATIKLFPAYLAIHYFATGRSRLLKSAVFAALALTIMTFLILGANTYQDYISVVIPAQTKFEGAGDNLSIAGFWHKLLDPIGQPGAVAPSWTPFPLTRLAITLTNLAITTIVIILSRRARTTPEYDLTFALAVTAMLLVSPVTWQITLVLLLVPIAILMHRGVGTKWLRQTLLLVMPIVLLPQRFLAELVIGDQALVGANEGSLLGTRSIKLYALLTMFGILCAILHAEKIEPNRLNTN